MVACLDPSQLSTSAVKDGSTWPVMAEGIREIGLPIKRGHLRHGVLSQQFMLDIFMHDRADDLHLSDSVSLLGCRQAMSKSRMSGH